jgi:hypothetical protein
MDILAGRKRLREETETQGENRALESGPHSLGLESRTREAIEAAENSSLLKRILGTLF